MRATRKKCGLPAEIRVTRRDAGTRSHAGKNPQKPETRTPVTRNYPKPDFSTRNPSLLNTLTNVVENGFYGPKKPQFDISTFFLTQIIWNLQKRLSPYVKT